MTFESVLSKMPHEFQCEILETDKYFKAMRPLKFRRTLDKNGSKITYVASEYGISYMFKISDNEFKHNFQWYIVYSGKAETWHRRADYMEETLARISEVDNPLSERIYDALKNCPGSDNCYGERCLARTPYSFNNMKKLTCHGSVELGVNQGGFFDAREFFRHFNELVKVKIANEEPPPEKILVCKMDRSI